MSERQHYVDLVDAALKAHGKRRPIGRGCIIDAWECTCGEEVVDHRAHVASEIVTDEQWAAIAEGVR